MMTPDLNSLLTTTYHHRWALLVGVNVYSDLAILNLKVCAGDVRAIYDLLVTNDYEPNHIKLLLAPGEPAQLPTRAEILSALTSMAQTAGEDDFLLFYFSGHGIAQGGEAFLLPSDTRYTTLTDTAVSFIRVKEIIQASSARAKVIILDACHSGSQIGKAPIGMTEEFMRHVYGEAEGLAILSSCKQQQVSWEWPEKEQSVFTHYLLQGLQGEADSQHKGFVTVSDINQYVIDKVKTWALQHNRVQVPTLNYTVAGDIVLVVKFSKVGIQAKLSLEMGHNAPSVIEVLTLIYRFYRSQPGEKVNSELIREKLGLSVEQMNDYILKLKERGFITAAFVGNRSLLSITADGVAVLNE